MAKNKMTAYKKMMMNNIRKVLRLRLLYITEAYLLYPEWPAKRAVAWVVTANGPKSTYRTFDIRNPEKILAKLGFDQALSKKDKKRAKAKIRNIRK